MKTQDQCQKIGKRIQSKRTAKRLDISEVAQTIKVVEQTIRHIESGDWDKLGARVYAQGQINAYAKLVGVTTDDIAEYFDSVARQESIEPADLMPARRSLVDRIGHPLNKLGYVAATALIAVPATFALIMAFQSRDADTGIETVQTAQDRATPDTEQTSVDPVLASMTPMIKQSSETTASVQIDGFEDTLGNAEVEQGDSISEETDTQLSDDATTDTSTQSDQSEPDYHGGLNLSIDDQVWVEINDLEGERLAYGLKSAGWSMDFPLTHGLHVRMGNADAVTATLDGEAYDLEPHTRQDIATFELPAG